jgi:hypothetical protein
VRRLDEVALNARKLERVQALARWLAALQDIQRTLNGGTESPRAPQDGDSASPRRASSVSILDIPIIQFLTGLACESEVHLVALFIICTVLYCCLECAANSLFPLIKHSVLRSSSLAKVLTWIVFGLHPGAWTWPTLNVCMADLLFGSRYRIRGALKLSWCFSAQPSSWEYCHLNGMQISVLMVNLLVED